MELYTNEEGASEVQVCVRVLRKISAARHQLGRR